MGISPWQLLILLAIVVLLFGTKKLRNMGSDVGSAVKGFKKSMKDEDNSADDKTKEKSADKSTTETSLKEDGESDDHRQ